MKTKTVMPHVKSVTYRSCLVLYEYEVIKVDSGYYPYETLRIAHFGVYDRKYTSKSRYRVGYEKAWKLMPLNAYPSISRIQMFDDLEIDFDKHLKRKFGKILTMISWKNNNSFSNQKNSQTNMVHSM